MMAVNRHRLRLRSKRGERGAKVALGLLARTDKLLGVILLGNTLVNAIATTVGFLLAPMLRLSYPVVWFVNLFVQGLLILLRLKPGEEVEARLSQEEVRSLVLEGHFFRGKHRAMLANLFDLASVSVDDVMTPRNQ